MITIVAKLILKPGKKEDFKVLTEELRRESRKEKGCISYNLYEDINNPSTGTIPKLSELQEGKSEIHLYKLIEDKF